MAQRKRGLTRGVHLDHENQSKGLWDVSPVSSRLVMFPMNLHGEQMKRAAAGLLNKARVMTSWLPPASNLSLPQCFNYFGLIIISKNNFITIWLPRLNEQQSFSVNLCCKPEQSGWESITAGIVFLDSFDRGVCVLQFHGLRRIFIWLLLFPPNISSWVLRASCRSARLGFIHTMLIPSFEPRFLLLCNFLSYFHFLHPRLSLGFKPSLWGLLLLLVPWCHSPPSAQSQIHTRLQVRGWMQRSSEKRLTSSEEIRKTVLQKKFNPSLSLLCPWTFASMARSNICVDCTSFIWRQETPFQQICCSAPTIWSNQCCAMFRPSLLLLRSPCSASVSLQITQWARDPILKMALIRACCHRHAGITEVRSQKRNTPAVASLLWWLNH